MSKAKLVHNRSSYLVIWPLIAAMFFGCILSFILKSYFLSLLLLIIGLVMLAARLWSQQAVKGLLFSVRTSATGVFPGEQVLFHIETKNEKFLPVMCTEVYFPLTADLCLTPEEIRPVEEYEKAYLSDQGASLEKVGEKSLPTLLWYESQTVRTKWTANRRGLYTTSGWKLRTGDGLGLSQMELPVKREDIRLIAVYPKILPVNTRIFMRMAWSADTGARGVMEDNTVIRSTREYERGDSIKHINWRLAARGLPLSVNVYEEILPQSVYFLFDGESFSGKEKHPEEMEEALSVVASVIYALDGKVQSGVSFTENARGFSRNVETGSPLEDLLWAFSEYSPKADLMNEDNKVIDRISEFDADVIEEELQRAGRFYFVTYDAKKVGSNEILKLLDQGKTTILSYVDNGKYQDFETLPLSTLYEADERKPDSETVTPAAIYEDDGHRQNSEAVSLAAVYENAGNDQNLDTTLFAASGAEVENEEHSESGEET